MKSSVLVGGYMRIPKILLLALSTAIPLVGISARANAGADVSVYFSVAPPPVRYEVAPPLRHGYVWIPGYWNVRHDHHVWQQAHWEHERRGYYYAPSRWVERNQRWQLQRGHWRQGDRDYDGVPNRYDHDRDGDGRSNRHDRSPNNRHRY